MLLQTVQQALIVNYVNLCAFTLLVYDSFLNIEDEIKYIWCKEWTFVKCVYLSSKYLAFVDAALTANLLLKHGLSSHECMSLYKTVVSLVWIGVVLAEVILQCHAWAISGLSRYVLGYLVVTDIIFFGLTLMSLVRSFEGFQFMAQSPISIIRPCFPKKTLPGNFIYIDYICIMVAETNVLIIMLWRGVVQWRGSGIALVHILYRDGMVAGCVDVLDGSPRGSADWACDPGLTACPQRSLVRGAEGTSQLADDKSMRALDSANRLRGGTRSVGN